jgi:hypothetical protein
MSEDNCAEKTSVGLFVELVYYPRELPGVMTARPRVLGGDILTQCLIGLIEYSYHQGIPFFWKPTCKEL